MANLVPVKLVALFLVYTLFGCEAFPGGAPFKSCAIIFPKHKGAERQTTASPYVISVSPSSYRPGQQLQVTMWSPQGLSFRGFQIRSQRVLGDREEILGSFQSYPDDVKPQFWYAETDKYNCLTHKNNNERMNLSFSWEAPSTSAGDIYFSATFIQSYSTFWYNVSSQVVTATVAASMSTSEAEAKTSLSSPITAAGCGVSKGCLMAPGYCTGDNCDYLVTYRITGDNIDFEIKAKADEYVTLAFSDDLKMGNDSSVACLKSKYITSIQHGYNPPSPLTNDKHRATGLANIEITKEGDHIYCRFRRPRSMSVKWIREAATPPELPVTFDLLTSRWYLFLAYGDLYDGTDVGHKHGPLPFISAGTVDLQAREISRAFSLTKEVKSHGALMLIAWVLFAGFSMIYARYYRDSFDGKMCCGTRIWFQVHRACAVMAFLCTAAAFVLIFVVKKEITKNALLHAIFGIVTQGLILLQVVGGMLRPGLDSPVRPWFTWGHRINGFLARIVAAVTIILAWQIEILPFDLRYKNTIVAGIWVGLELVWLIILEAKKCQTNKADGVESYELPQMSDSKKALDQKPVASSSTSCDMILLVLYFISILALSVISVVFVVSY